MRDDLSCLAVVIDKSGSMFDLTNSTIANYNSFIKEQKEVPGEALVTLTIFNHEIKIVEVMRPIKEIAPLTTQDYLPGGNTALYDAVGETIKRVGELLGAMPEEQRPGKVIMTIITDGMENSSRNYDHDAISNMIKHQQDVYGWQFIFLGANMDVQSVAASMSIPVTNTVAFAANEEGLAGVYSTASAMNRRMRRS